MFKKKPWTPNETFFFCGRPKEKLTNVQDALFRAITMNGNRLLNVHFRVNYSIKCKVYYTNIIQKWMQIKASEISCKNKKNK